LKIRVLLLSATLSAIAGAAFADGAGVASLQTSVAKSKSLMAGDGYWVCKGDSCTTEAATDASLNVSACRTIVKAAGPITSYSIGSESLPANLLAKCNAAAEVAAGAH